MAFYFFQSPIWVIFQTNGWIGGDAFKIKPDQIQLANPIMILLLLPLFTNVIYPLLEKCGLKVTLLRRMSLGQIITGLVSLWKYTIIQLRKIQNKSVTSIIIWNGSNCSKLDWSRFNKSSKIWWSKFDYGLEWNL